MKIKLLLLLILFSGCSTARVINSHKNFDKTPLDTKKVLVLGITPHPEARKAFEFGLQKDLGKKRIEVVPSLTYFPQDLLQRKLTLAEVSQLEQQLISDNFNAVIIARVISVENKENLIDYLSNLNRTYINFKNDYFENQSLNLENEETIDTKIFHTETGIYNISKGDMRDLIWRGRIDIVNPEKTKNAVKHYIHRLIQILKKEEIFIF